MNFVYFAADAQGMIKIGKSIRPEHRCRSMHLRVLAVMKGDYSVESALHRRFRADRADGHGREFFKPSEELRSFIAALIFKAAEGKNLHKPQGSAA